MAGINRRPSRRQQRQECRLRPLQVEGGLVIAVRTDLFEVEVPGLARVHAQLFAAAAEQQFPGAFDVGGGKGLAVVPLDALPQFERQLLAVLAPGPALGEVGADRLRAVLRDLLVVHDQVVENAHARPQRRAGRLLVQRQARRVVEKRDLQNTAGFLRRGRPRTERKQQRARNREPAQYPLHDVSSRCSRESHDRRSRGEAVSIVKATIGSATGRARDPRTDSRCRCC